MQISAKISEKFLPITAEIGYCGTDESFLSYDERDRILTAEYTQEVLNKYEKIRAVGMRVCQTHMTYLPSHRPRMDEYAEYEAYFMPLYEKEITLTAQMGCPTTVMHPYFTDDAVKSREVNVRLIERMLPMLEKNGVILSLENIYGAAYGEAHHSAAEDMLYYAECFRSPYVGICLDTGHAVIRGQDPSAMLRKTAPYLTALHAHATVPGMDLHTIPCTVGQKIKWTEIAQILKESPYKGTFNMEIKPPSQLSEAASVLFYQLAYRIAWDLLGEE
ncbi:MAG: sugar phosphate isomerase/epimerase [Ruminococcaceae bacterium]|nr:sugar phosphate isomerase/epimerase [Oscillospiraceae bacterium]